MPPGVGVEVFNVGWLTHGDFALETGVDFLAVVEHMLIPARVRSEWSRLGGKGIASIWAPACQDTSHVGNTGVGVVSLKGAPVLMPTFATAYFQRFIDCGRAIRRLLPIGGGRFLNLVLPYGYQVFDDDAEQLPLTEQLFDAALAELAVVARGSPCLLAGDFNVEPTKIPCLSKGISAGLWVDLDAAWSAAGVSSLLLRVSVVGFPRAEIVGIFWLVARLLLLLYFLVLFVLEGGCSSILLLVHPMIVTGGLAG